MTRSIGYGFTTKQTDNFIPRICQEAKKTDNFLVVQSNDIKSRVSVVHLLARRSSLPSAKENITVAGIKLKKSIRDIESFNGFVHYVIQTNNAKKTANIVRNDLHRLKNYLEGKTTRVKVESI